MEPNPSTEVRHEGDPAFPVEPEQKKTAPESSTETKPEETTTDPSPEVKKEDVTPAAVPFHEDPKVQDYINRQVEKRLDEGLKEKFAPKEEDVSIPAWFGGDAEAWKLYQADQQKLIDEAKSATIKEIEGKKQSEDEAQRKALEYFNSSVKEIETSGTKVDRNKLLKFVIDNELIDGQGRWNYKKGFEFMQALESVPKDPAALNQRKEIAASTTSDTKAEAQPKTFKTPNDFRGGNRPW